MLPDQASVWLSHRSPCLLSLNILRFPECPMLSLILKSLHMLFSWLRTPLSFHLSLLSSCLTDIQAPKHNGQMWLGVARKVRRWWLHCVNRLRLDFITNPRVVCGNKSPLPSLNVAGINYGTQLLNKLINKEHFFPVFRMIFLFFLNFLFSFFKCFFIIFC